MILHVIIVTFNGIQWIEKCLNSVFQSSIKSIPIVIDNGSSDGTVSFIKQNYQDAIVIETGQNLGFGKANNIGIQYAIQNGAEYIYLLNQDAWVDSDVFEKLVKIHKNNKEYVILSPLHLAANGLTVDKGFYTNSLGQGRCPGLYNDYLCGTVKEVYPTSFVMAAHWLLYVPTLKKVGLFSPVFPHYGEDNNFIDRARYFNYKIGVCPSVKAYHDRQFRIIPPEKQLYKEKISLLAILNNPALNRLDRTKRFIRFIVRVLRVKKTSILKKIETLKQGIEYIKVSRRYRYIYITEDCFEKFKVTL